MGWRVQDSLDRERREAEGRPMSLTLAQIALTIALGAAIWLVWRYVR